MTPFASSAPRRRRGELASAALCLALAASMPTLAGEAADDDRDEAPSANPAAALSREPGPQASPQSLQLTEAQRQTAGLEVIVARRAEVQPEIAVLGKIVDLSPLLELRARYRAALSEFKIAEAASALALQNRDRLAKLNQEAIIANKELVRADSELTSVQVRSATSRQRLGEIREEALHSWGPELFRLAIAEDSELWNRLLTRREALLLIALPANMELPAGTRQVYVARNRDRQHAVVADFLAPAPNTDTVVQGETYFFHVNALRLRTGMRVDAWIANRGGAAAGVFIPAAAVLWHGGSAWVYVETRPGNFERRPLRDAVEYGSDWFVRTGFRGGEHIVTVGGQLLLSEEMQRQIPREDDD